MSNESFFFEDAVGVIERTTNEFREPVRAIIELVQNGYKLQYENKKFVAKNLKEGLDMIKSWMEEKEKKASGESKSESEHE